MSASRLAVAALVSFGVVACSGRDGRDSVREARAAVREARGAVRDARNAARDAARQASRDAERNGSNAGASLTFSTSNAKARRGEPTFSTGPGGEAWMSTTDGAMMMGIRHDSILVAFSDSLRHAVMTEVDTSMKHDADMNDDDAIGKAIGGIVQGTVKAALSEVFEKERGFPIADVRAIRYEGGEIVFDYRHKPMIRPESVKNDDAPITRRFHPADAARFVGAVRARM